MFDPHAIDEKPHREKPSFLQKFACFIGKRVLTPTFGEKIEKAPKVPKKFINNESSNQESTLDMFEVSQSKKETKPLIILKHPKISRKSPLFPKFNVRMEELPPDISKISDFNDNSIYKKPELPLNKDKIIYRKREFSAKKPRESSLINENNLRLMTPQVKNVEKSVTKDSFLFDLNKSEIQTPKKGIQEIIEKLEKVIFSWIFARLFKVQRRKYGGCYK